jgi:hypothetical protein
MDVEDKDRVYHASHPMNHHLDLLCIHHVLVDLNLTLA